jgi:topoisomerase IA-like protein|tara:strand:- start:488 stop:787 length:300 start_codon:yes stop_codon:yes gene_type:complete
MNEIMVIKMMNGEEIITKISKEDEETIQCEKPAIIMLSPNQNGKGVQVQMGPYSAFTDKPIAINKQAVLYIAEPNTEILNSYNKNFGSGLIIPNQTLMG